MNNELYKAVNYKADTPYIISRYIREYDIEKANINVLYSLNLLTKEEYDRLYNSSRMERQIQIGLLQRTYPEISKALKKGIVDVKKLFFEENNIQYNDVLAIKNDAIYVIDKVAYNTKFGMVEFKNKNTYTSYYSIPMGKLEMYYYIDTVNSIEKLDIKGIREEMLNSHENHFMEFLKVLFCSAETESIKDTIDLLVTFYDNYINLNLDTQYYREFNSFSSIKLKKLSSIYEYRAEVLDDRYKDQIDISYNLNILRYLHQIFSGILFSRNPNRI